MEFFENYQTIIIVIVIAIVVIAIYSFISRKIRQKQEEEMNNNYNYSSTTSSKPKVPKNEPKKQTHYKFSLETGELINKTDIDNSVFIESSEQISNQENNDVFSKPDKTNLDSNVIQLLKKNLDKLNLSEEKKKEILAKLKRRTEEKSENNDISLEQKIKVIENSKMSDKQKMKLIELLKKKSNSGMDF